MKLARIEAIVLPLALMSLEVGRASAAQNMGADALVIIGSDTVRVEIASTPAQREEGLKYREEVPDGTGMLFVFQAESVRSFWMMDTYVALDIAYIDAKFRIIDIQQMEPLTTDLHVSARPAMFALEVRKGWFEERGVRVGDDVELILSGG
ncbi:MAG: hypothetical protein BMS9Abin29_1734 [Gemmatimonadota bacterium]|nr:MAG: hypothetical protein BMS9Abin29_1734 [Gemmatimonadota bacterium]